MAKVYLHELGSAPGAKIPEIASYLSRVRGIEVVQAGSMTSELEALASAPRMPLVAEPPRSAPELARALAGTRVHDLNRRDSFADPLPAEVAFLERQLRGGRGAFGHVYDGMAAMSVLKSVLRTKGGLTLIFTNQIIGTWDDGDLRYHARVLVAGSPAVISVPGVVVAPARPREYYMYQQRAKAAGASDDEIEIKMWEVMGERFVLHGDPRISEILKGYALQAVAYWIFGESFCDDPDCRLFNAHWQEEMIRAQLGKDKELCDKHSLLLGM